MHDEDGSQSEILDHCLSSIQSGEATVARALLNYPEHAEALWPLLSLAVEMHERLAPPAPESAFASALQARLLNRLHASAAEFRPAQQKPPVWPWAKWRPAYALATLLIAIALLAASAGAVHASSKALPGDALYPAKRAMEELRLALTLTAPGDTALLAELSDERVAEAEALTAAGRESDLMQALAGYEDLIARLLDQAEQAPPTGGPASLEQLVERLAHQAQALEGMQAQVSPQAQQAVGEAIQHSSHGQAVIEWLRQGGSPSELAPGQLKKASDPAGDSGALNRQKEATKAPAPTKDKTLKPEKDQAAQPTKDKEKDKDQ